MKLIFIIMFSLSMLTVKPEVDWRRSFNNAYNISCCGESDCTKATNNSTGYVGELVFTERFGNIVVNRVHPSLDGRPYICTTGCFFSPIGV